MLRHSKHASTLVVRKEKGVRCILAVHKVTGAVLLKPFRAVNAEVCVQSTQRISLADEMQPGPVIWPKAEMGLKAKGAEFEVRISNKHVLAEPHQQGGMED